MMQGERKLKIAFLALAVFLIVAVLAVIFNRGIEYLALGGGIAAICGTIIYGYYKEYQHKDTPK